MGSKAPLRHDKESSDVITRLITLLCGEDAVKVVKALLNENEMIDELIAERTGMRLNQVRRILYDLLDKHIVTYRREIDEEKGYFLYFWSLNKEGLREIVRERKKLVLERLCERLQYEEQKVFFICPNGCGDRVPFERAMDQQFKCLQCGAMLQSFDNQKMIEKLKAKIEVLKKDP